MLHSVEMLVTQSVCLLISIGKLIDQDFYPQFPMSLDWRFEYAIVAQIQILIPNNVQWYRTPGDVNCFAYLSVSYVVW